MQKVGTKVDAAGPIGDERTKQPSYRGFPMPIASTQTEFKSPKEIASLCGLSPRAIYRAISRGELPASRLCGRLRCRTVDVENWIERNLVEPVPTLKQLPPDGRAVRGSRGSLRQMLRTTAGSDDEH
jgi:excisionase family DNA binding protein